jgi:hypothetical protein
MRTPSGSPESGSVVPALVALIGLICVLIFASFAWKSMSRRMDVARMHGVRPASDRNAAFVEAWSVTLRPPLVYEMALSPGQPGEFFALDNDRIYRFDASSGASRGMFEAPTKSQRIATDPAGAMPYVLVVSSKTKWTGAIDYTVTTD